jgi:hypothetical protein
MLLFVVEEVFATRVGLILTPGVGKHPVRAGTAIRLVRPDGSILHAKICGIVFSILFLIHERLIPFKSWIGISFSQSLAIGNAIFRRLAN